MVDGRLRERRADAHAARAPATARARPARRGRRGPARAAGARRADRARHGRRRRRARRDARPVEDGLQPDRRPLRRGRGDRHRRLAGAARRHDRRERAALPRAEDRLQRLNGVVAAGTLSDVDVGGQLVSSVPVNDPLGQTRFQLPVKAASPGLWRAVRAQLQTGRVPDAGHSARADRVVVLGPNAARRLNITRVDQQPAVFIGDRLYVVIGILERVDRQPSLLGAVIMPEGTALREFGLAAPGLAQIETRVGAVELDRAPGADGAQRRRSPSR